MILLLLALSVQALNKVRIVLSYYANTAAYAKNCENKSRPQMHCNGKCQMMKKLRQEQNKDESAPERRSLNDEVISSRSHFPTLSIFKAQPAREFVLRNNNTVRDVSPDFFHPPAWA